MPANEPYDVVIVGGGPGGLAAALTLGRGRKRVLLCDAGPRRNAAAEHIYNFVTRDGTVPDDFRRIGREQLAKYTNVQVVDARVESVTGSKGAFAVGLTSSVVESRRVLLCSGMIDQMLPIKGFAELWGQAIFQCPYCHGWEIQDRKWAFLVNATEPAMLRHFALLTLGWTNDLVVVSTSQLELPPEIQGELIAAGIRLERAPVARLHSEGQHLQSIELSDGTVIPCDFIFTHPPQTQVPLVAALGLTLDDHGYVQVDPMSRETSTPGIYAAGDLTTRMQAATLAAAAGMGAAAAINAELTAELAIKGELKGLKNSKY